MALYSGAGNNPRSRHNGHIFRCYHNGQWQGMDVNYCPSRQSIIVRNDYIHPPVNRIRPAAEEPHELPGGMVVALTIAASDITSVGGHRRVGYKILCSTEDTLRPTVFKPKVMVGFNADIPTHGIAVAVIAQRSCIFMHTILIRAIKSTVAGGKVKMRRIMNYANFRRFVLEV